MKPFVASFKIDLFWHGSRRLLLSLPVAVAVLAAAPIGPAETAAPAAARAVAKSITLDADDGVKVYASFYMAEHPKALVLLFHQADSSKDEYAQIAPRLVAAGYSALAIDQRSGGELFGKNETVAKLGHDASYLDAKRDLEAAVSWAERQKLPIVLWGSSYSASLVFLVAAESRPGVKAIMAFSPGEYLDTPKMVGDAAAHVSVPIFATSANSADEIAAARSLLAAAPARQKTQYVPSHGGVHGSSTLLVARNPKGAAANWRAALGFLAKAL